MTRQPTNTKQSNFERIYTKYPAPTLALTMLFSVTFTLGATWATASGRITRLEDNIPAYATKEELNTIKALIQGLNEKIDYLIRTKRV